MHEECVTNRMHLVTKMLYENDTTLINQIFIVEMQTYLNYKLCLQIVLLSILGSVFLVI